MIPFAKTIENFLAALPTQAALEVKIRELAAQIDVLKAENAKLKDQVATLQPKSGMDTNAAKMLKLLYDIAEKDENAEIEAEHMAKFFQLKNNLIQYHLGKLVSDGYADSRSGFGEGYYITPAGRAFVIEKGLG